MTPVTSSTNIASSAKRPTDTRRTRTRYDQRSTVGRLATAAFAAASAATSAAASTSTDCAHLAMEVSRTQNAAAKTWFEKAAPDLSINNVNSYFPGLMNDTISMGFMNENSCGINNELPPTSSEAYVSAVSEGMNAQTMMSNGLNAVSDASLQNWIFTLTHNKNETSGVCSELKTELSALLDAVNQFKENGCPESSTLTVPSLVENNNFATKQLCS